MRANKRTAVVVVIMLGVFAGIIFTVNQHLKRELEQVHEETNAYQATPIAVRAPLPAGQALSAGGSAGVTPAAAKAVAVQKEKEEKVIYEMPTGDVILVQ